MIQRMGYSVMLVLLLVVMVGGCNAPTGNHSDQLSEEMTTQTILLNDMKVTVSLPRDYFAASRDQVSAMPFYYSDVTRTPMDPIYISSADPRAHLSVHAIERRVDAADTGALESVYDRCLMELFLSDKASPAMPLIEKYCDRKGFPYAYIMHVTRYNVSDSLWRNHPDTFICPTGADSVECSFYYHTMHGPTEYIIHYYSLESFEGFSFQEKRAVLESIDFSDF